jgi:hypothetical protein
MLKVEMKKHILMADSIFKMKINIDCHGPRLLPDIRQYLYPPYLSLLITFWPSVFLNSLGTFDFKVC